MNPSILVASLRDLAVLLHRRNAEAAEPVLTEIGTRLQELMVTTPDPADASFRRAQQTMFALEEVRASMNDGDFPAAVAAARDASREWTAQAGARR
jgi:hypothetical protein